MKYIRNQWGIYELFEEFENVVSVKRRPTKAFGSYIYWIQKKDIKKQADSIEELCDEFVCCVGIDNPHYEIYHAITVSVANIRFWYPNITILYGAIWADKGLIYVAKMNNKGKLELL